MSTIFSSAFAPGGLFACGDNSGCVRLLGSSGTASVSVGHGPVYAMCAPSDQAIVCGGDYGISLIDSATHSVKGRLAPASANAHGPSRQKMDAETNAMVSDAQVPQTWNHGQLLFFVRIILPCPLFYSEQRRVLLWRRRPSACLGWA
jgi:hypothetical protein